MSIFENVSGVYRNILLYKFVRVCLCVFMRERERERNQRERKRHMHTYIFTSDLAVMLFQLRIRKIIKNTDQFY